jgi:hypothetical protein
VAGLAAGGAIEKGTRRVEGDDLAGGISALAVVARSTRRPWTVRIGNGVDGKQGQTLAVVLDPRGLRGMDQRAGDGDHAAGEEALVELPRLAVDGHRGVAAHATALADGERGAQHVLGDGVGAAVVLGLVPHGARRATQECGVWRDVVVLVEEGAETDLDVVQRADAAEIVEAGYAERAPEALMPSSA